MVLFLGMGRGSCSPQESIKLHVAVACRVCSNAGFSPDTKSAPSVHILEADCINEAADFTAFLDAD